MAFFLAILITPSANVTVTTMGRPSGMAEGQAPPRSPHHRIPLATATEQQAGWLALPNRPHRRPK